MLAQWSGKLNDQGQAITDRVSPDVMIGMEKKRIALIRRLIGDFGQKDEQLVKDLACGFKAVGPLDACGASPAVQPEAAATMDDLVNAAKWSQMAVVSYLRRLGEARHGAMEKCVEDASDKGTMKGPFHK